VGFFWLALGFTFREVYIGGNLDDKLDGSSLSLGVMPREFNKMTADWHVFYWATLTPTATWTSQQYANVYETALGLFDKARNTRSFFFESFLLSLSAFALVDRYLLDCQAQNFGPLL